MIYTNTRSITTVSTSSIISEFHNVATCIVVYKKTVLCTVFVGMCMVRPCA
jgi:hypothetical protein